MAHNNILKYVQILLLMFITPVSFATDPGDQILEEKCVLCHQKPDPAKLTKAQWVVKIKRMAPAAGLSSDETSKVLDYVSSLAKDAASVLTMVNEKELFDEKCSLCHTTNRALIMPMTAESVNEIIPRMQAMAGSWISDNQAHKISEYLIHGAPDSKRPTRKEISTQNPYELFLQRCTACHTAEQVFTRLKSDKKNETVAAWPNIVNRMRQKAPNWITESEAQIITGFLNNL